MTIDNDQVLCFEKATPDRSNVLIVAISFDPGRPQSVTFDLPGAAGSAAVEADDLLTGQRAVRAPGRQRIDLTPDHPYAIWRILPAS